MTTDARISHLNNESIDPGGRYVLYWMQASQRAYYNHALEYAAARANELAQPVVVGFGLTEAYPAANLRHFAFMLQGLAETRAALAKRGIALVARRGSPPQVALDLGRDASLIVADRGYLRHQRRWRDEVADSAGRCVVQVESDVIVPVEAASDKLESAARTLRPKILRAMDRYLDVIHPVPAARDSLGLDFGGDVDLADITATLVSLRIDRTVPPSPRFIGGTTHARKLVQTFLAHKLEGYANSRGEPAAQRTATISPYLHFGHISPLEIALRVKRSALIPAPPADREAFLEQLIVRRELAINHAYHNPRYDEYAGLPAWARQTLDQHRRDRREQVYSAGAELEAARTHDPYWNAAQREMVATGYMQSYMRMYWGKKMLEWKQTPEEAYADILYLNDRYFLCGRDANSYANIGWIFGVHDRPWARRPVFGTVRYMNAAGLERKFDMEAYLRVVEGLAGHQT